MMIDEKRLLRDEMRRRKTLCPTAERAQQSAAVVEQLLHEPLYVAARSVMLYWPLPDEVDIRALIDDALHRKRVILPVVAGNDVVPVELTDTSQLHSGRFGIPEPCGSRYEGPIDLVVVPGVAFDGDGRRLGRGRGYYDRFLAALPSVPTIGVAFDFQIVPHVPCAAHDMPMHKVIAGK